MPGKRVRLRCPMRLLLGEFCLWSEEQPVRPSRLQDGRVQLLGGLQPLGGTSLRQEVQILRHGRLQRETVQLPGDLRRVGGVPLRREREALQRVRLSGARLQLRSALRGCLRGFCLQGREGEGMYLRMQ